MLDDERHATTSKLKIAYTDTGPADGPVVFLLHGWPDSARAWRQIIPQLNAAGFRTIAPELRGFGATRFLRGEIVRDGTGVALAQDAIDLADAIGIDRFDAVGHDWGARAAYSLAALYPDRMRRIAALALPFQPRGAFTLPETFAQARRFWYQWFMSLDDGPAAVRADPKGFARIQWDTLSPSGWFDEAEFATTARAFENPDWVDITLNGYRTRWRKNQPTDPDYDALRTRLQAIDRIAVPTLMIQGGADQCDDPALSRAQDVCFTGGYQRLVLEGIGHFPPREAPEAVARALVRHLS